MKRIALILAALMLLASASAETRRAEIWLEGMPEPATETLYRSGLGFSFWYDEARLAVEETEDRVRVRPVGATGADIRLEILPSGTVGELPWKYLELNAPADAAYEEDLSETGLEIHGFEKAAADGLEGFYALEGTADFLAARTLWPREAAEGYGARLLRTLWSAALNAETPVRAIWAEELAEDAERDFYEVPGDGEKNGVALIAVEPVADFRLTSLSLEDVDEEGRPDFAERTLYAQEALTPGRPLAARLAFVGDLPEYGFICRDAAGAERRFALEISGRDGSLQLVEY